MHQLWSLGSICTNVLLLSSFSPFGYSSYIIIINMLKWILAESFGGINDDTLLNSLGLLNEVNSVDVVNVCLPNLPAPPNAFRGIRRKSSSLKRWLAICSDDLIELVD